jgi:hypothetical protein
VGFEERDHARRGVQEGVHARFVEVWAEDVAQVFPRLRDVLDDARANTCGRCWARTSTRRA